MAKDSYWFRHDSTSGRGLRIKKIQHLYGHWGKGVYWDIVELLREQDHYRYPADADSLQVLSGIIGLQEHSRFIQWFNDCVKFELLTISDGYFSCEVLNENMKVWESKKNNRKGAKKDKQGDLFQETGDAARVPVTIEHISSEENLLKISRNNTISMADMKLYLADFSKDRDFDIERYKSVWELKQHFNNYCKKRIEIQRLNPQPKKNNTFRS